MSIPRVLNLIPLASLAAVLFVVGYKLAKPSLIKKMYQQGKAQFVPFIITVLAIVFTDLLIGIGMGLVVAIFYVLYNNYKKPYFFFPEKHEDGAPIRFELAEDVTFLNKASILQTLNHLPENSKVIIDATNTINIDLDVIEIIEDFRENAQYRNIELEVLGLYDEKKSKESVRDFTKLVRNGNVGNGKLALQD